MVGHVVLSGLIQFGLLLQTSVPASLQATGCFFYDMLDNYQRFGHETYRIRATGQTLTVSVLAEFDTTLVLRSPDGAFFVDDDGGDRYQASLQVKRPVAGDWLVFVTPYSASVRDQCFTLTVDGAESRIGIASTVVDVQLLAEAFCYRGVEPYGPKSVLAHDRLDEQLEHASLRSAVILDLQAAFESPVTQDLILSLEQERAALENRLSALTTDKQEISGNDPGNRVTLALLREETSFHEGQLTAVTSRLAQLERRKSIMRDVLTELQGADQEIKNQRRLYNQYLSTGSEDQALFHAYAKARKAWWSNRYRLAKQLVELGFQPFNDFQKAQIFGVVQR